MMIRPVELRRNNAGRILLIPVLLLSILNAGYSQD